MPQATCPKHLLLSAADVAAAHLRLGFMYENGIGMRVSFKVSYTLLPFLPPELEACPLKILSLSVVTWPLQIKHQFARLDRLWMHSSFVHME